MVIPPAAKAAKNLLAPATQSAKSVYESVRLDRKNAKHFETVLTRCLRDALKARGLDNVAEANIQKVAEFARTAATEEYGKSRSKPARWVEGKIDRVRRKTSDLSSLRSERLAEAVERWLRIALARRDSPVLVGDPEKLAGEASGLLGPVLEEILDSSAASKDEAALRPFVSRLVDAININDARTVGRHRAGQVGSVGTALTAILGGFEGFAHVPQLLPATAVLGALSVLAVAWIGTKARAAPSATDVWELQIGTLDPVRSWLYDVVESQPGDVTGLIKVLDERLLPRLKVQEVRLLPAALERIKFLLEDRAAERPSFNKVKLDLAVAEATKLVSPSLATTPKA